MNIGKLLKPALIKETLQFHPLTLLVSQYLIICLKSHYLTAFEIEKPFDFISPLSFPIFHVHIKIIFFKFSTILQNTENTGFLVKFN